MQTEAHEGQKCKDWS